MNEIAGTFHDRMTLWRTRLAGYARLDLVALLSLSLLLIGYFALRASPQRDMLYAAAPFLLVYIHRHRDLLATPGLRLGWAALGAYWLYNLASVAWSPAWDVLTVLTYARYELMGLVFTASLAVLLARHPDAWRFLSAVFVGAAMAAAVVIAVKYGLALHRHGHFVRLEGVGRGGNSNICAAFYATAILLTLYAPAGPRPTALFSFRAVWLAVFGAIVVLTMGRGPLVALIAVLLAITALRGHWRVLAGLGVACLFAGAFVLFNPADWGQMMGRGDDNRFDLWRQAFAMIRAHPVFGSGVATALDFYAPQINQHFDSTHDAYLGALVYGGACGLGVLLVMLAAILRQAWRLFRRTGQAAPLALSLYGLVYFLFEAHTLVLNVNPEWLFFLLPAGLAMGLSPDLSKPENSAILRE